jgi:hypothetical protein
MINLFNKPKPEADARAYCRTIGADPDAMVWGKTFAAGPILKPRWQWYVSQGAADRSPVYSQEN